MQDPARGLVPQPQQAWRLRCQTDYSSATTVLRPIVRNKQFVTTAARRFAWRSVDQFVIVGGPVAVLTFVLLQNGVTTAMTDAEQRAAFIAAATERQKTRQWWPFRAAAIPFYQDSI
jgi:hypothetical protein